MEGYPAGRNYHVNDADETVRYYRAMTTLVVRRVIAGIPNVQARWSNVSHRLWTEGEISEYTSSTPDPDGVLRTLLGRVGLAMLKQAEPMHYQLLAVALPGEVGVGPQDAIAGGLPGKPPSINLTVTNIAGGNVSIRTQLVDPLENDNVGAANAAYLALVDWGDDRSGAEPYIQGTSNVWKHVYEKDGTYLIRVWIENTAGLFALQQISVNVNR